MSPMTTFAPSSTNRRTVARPMPEPPPVMTETRLLVAAERRPVADRRVRVDAEVAGLDGARDPQAAAEVVGEDRAGESVLGVVRLGDRVGLVVERHHRHDRPEDLLAPDPVG